MKKTTLPLTILLIFFSIACSTSTDNTNSISSMDFHMHIQSADAALHLDSLKKIFGSGDTLNPESPHTGQQLLDLAYEAGLDGAAAVSLAYLFGLPDFEIENEYDFVKKENDYTASEVSKLDNLKGFGSVNPLKDYATKEVIRIFDELNLDGLKLHLANSDMDLKDSGQLQQLSKVLDICLEREKPLLIHMRNRNPEYGNEDVKNVIEQLLIPKPGLKVVFAHLAGWGGWDQNTMDALMAFKPYFESGQLSKNEIYFDFSAVITNNNPDDSTRNQSIAEHIRALGAEKFVFGSDYGITEPLPYIELLKSAIPLSDTEWDAIMASPDIWN